MNTRHLIPVIAFLLLAGQAPSEAGPPPASIPAPRLLHPSGVPVDDSYFPIAVWLQDPRNAPRFKAAGINLYVGLWNGPTEPQLAALKQAGMPVICDQGCDIGSFDIYPVVHETPEVTGKLEFVARGVERLVKWHDPKKLVWNCIECTDMHGVGRKATPAQIRAEVWMSLIRGSRGLIYFVHQFKPDFKEAALLSDPETLAAVTAINQQIKELAPVLNSTKQTGTLTISPAASPVAAMLRHHGSWFLFAVNLSPQPADATFTVETATSKKATVLGESREVEVQDGKFTDHFDGYGVHLYRLP